MCGERKIEPRREGGSAVSDNARRTIMRTSMAVTAAEASERNDWSPRGASVSGASTVSRRAEMASILNNVSSIIATVSSTWLKRLRSLPLSSSTFTAASSEQDKTQIIREGVRV
jgi:hypothetical protein